MAPVKGLRERLRDGETVLIAEGYVFEMERRGYLQAGPFVPEAVLEHPELVEQLSEEFVHAGSDIVLAFTFQYYAHREKLKMIGRENDLERMNMEALRIARKVADKTGTLMAGNICNSCCFNKDDPATWEESRNIFKEEVEWAVKGGADLLVAETYNSVDEARLALEAMQKYGNGLPTVISLLPTAHQDPEKVLEYARAIKSLEDAGADCVGLNCGGGPQTIVPQMRVLRSVCKGPLCCLPVAYRTTEKEPLMLALTMDGEHAFFENLDGRSCPRKDFVEFGNAMKEIGVQYVGICCGNASRYMRTLAETMGRTPAASRYSPNMSKHYVFGSDTKLHDFNTSKSTGYRSDYEAILRSVKNGV